MEYCIEVKNLTKKYADFIAVDNINLQIKKGICFCILGPNGAGKTTFMEMIEGIKQRTSGEISINGLNPDKDISRIQAMMGVQLQETNYFENLSLDKLLRFFLDLYPGSLMNRDYLFNLVGLIENRKQTYTQLSGGQKQRFSIAVALVNDPEIIFLDEPTTGLDPQNRQYIWKLVNDLKAKNKTIIMTTHYMEEADRLADEIIIVDHGKIIIHGSPSEIKRHIKGDSSITVLTEGKHLAESDVKKIQALVDYKKLTDTDGWKIWTSNLVESVRSIYNVVDLCQAKVAHLEVNQVTLEDVFINITGRALRE